MKAPIARKSLALICADIAGTSRLMAEQGDLVVARTLQEFIERVGKLGKDHHCLLIKFIGDGFLAAFEVNVDVLPFVSAVQTLLKTNPVLRIHRLGCRFSLHFGTAMCIKTSYGYDVFGDDVNVVAHMNDLAQPGEMVVSLSALAAVPSELQVKMGKSEWGRVKGDDIEFHRVALVEC
jgi:adenylate cyclase